MLIKHLMSLVGNFRRGDKDNKETWRGNLTEEKEFWESIADKSSSNQSWVNEFHLRAASDEKFPLEFEGMLPKDLSKVAVLDVGAGPITALGSIHADKEISITPVDPLADFFNKLLKDNNIANARAQTQYCEAECLLDKFEPESFDFVYSRNALDHSYDPMLGIKQMIEVCKKGSYIFIQGSVNEGEKNSYAGLHQWNFVPTPEGDDLIIWNKTHRYSLKEELGEKVVIESSGNEWYSVKFLRVR